jgi:phosphomannomutase/phosphomannomutase/phosphoglucomutase
MIPWLLVLEIMAKSGKPLSELLAERMQRFPASGEINRRLKDPRAAIARIEKNFGSLKGHIDYTDGLSMEFNDWRFNLRCSNTEPVLRLNVEARSDEALMMEKTSEILEIIDFQG